MWTVPSACAFIPYLRALAQEICRGCSTPAEKARAIYNYATRQVGELMVGGCGLDALERETRQELLAFALLSSQI